MKRSLILAMIVTLVAAGTAVAQQAAPGAATRVTPPTRSYRSYSVQPSASGRGNQRVNERHAGEASWRNAGSKAEGHFNTGR